VHLRTRMPQCEGRIDSAEMESRTFTENRSKVRSAIAECPEHAA
jgi:hypothetical protein